MFVLLMHEYYSVSGQWGESNYSEHRNGRGEAGAADDKEISAHPRGGLEEKGAESDVSPFFQISFIKLFVISCSHVISIQA